jgi:hypothetical protein
MLSFSSIYIFLYSGIFSSLIEGYIYDFLADPDGTKGFYGPETFFTSTNWV